MSLPRAERRQTASEPLDLTDDGLRRVRLGQRPRAIPTKIDIDKKEQNMTGKSVFALAAILALGSLSLATNASAEHGGGGRGGGGGHFSGGGGGHFGGSSGGHFGSGSSGHFGGGGGGHFGGGGGHIASGRFATGHGPGAPIVAGRGPGPGIHVAPGYRAHVFVAGGHRRHFWHGRWWYYGVGPCWVWSDYYGEYVRACG